jgi:hypothetical protein
MSAQKKRLFRKASSLTDLLFLSDLAQLETVKRRFPHLLSDAHPVTGSLAVAAELERLGIPFSDELSYLEAHEIACNFNLAYQLTTQWWDEELADTRMLGFSLAQAARQEWALPIELCLNAALAYRRLLEAKSVTGIYGFFFPPTAMCRTGPAPAFRPATSITQAVLRWLADSAAIPVSDLRSNSDFITDQRQWRPLLTMDSLTSAVVGSNSSSYPSKETVTRLAMLWTSGLWPQEIAELERGFARVPDWKLIKISKRILTLGESSSQQRERNHMEEKLDRAWQKCESSLMDYVGSYAEIFGNSYLQFQFARIFSEMRVAVQLGLSFARLLDSLGPSLVLFGHDAFTIERTLVQIARHRGTPTVGLFHGGLQPIFARLGLVGDADRVMVWSEQDVKDLTRFDVSADRLRKVGSLRLEKMDQRALPLSASDAKKVEARHKLNLSASQPLILLLTSPTNIGLSQATADPVRQHQTWRDIVSLAERRSDLTFAIKPHPAYDFVEFYRHLCCTGGPHNLVLLEAKSHELVFRASDVAVLVNYCSTVALEAMLVGVPLVFLRSAIYQTEMHEDPLEKRGAINVSSVSELEHSVDRLLGDESFRQEALNDASLAMDALLGDRAQPALKQVMAELENIATTPNVGCDSGTSDLPESTCGVFLQMRRLLISGDVAQLRSHVKELLPAVSSENTELSEDILWSLAFTIGYSIEHAKQIRKVVRICFEEASKEPAFPRAALTGIITRIYLVAIIHSMDLSFWRRARILLWHLLWQTRGRVLRQSLFWSCLAKSLIGRNRYAVSLVNAADRLRVLVRGS